MSVLQVHARQGKESISASTDDSLEPKSSKASVESSDAATAARSGVSDGLHSSEQVDSG